MNSSQLLQLLSSTTCEDINEFIKELNASDYESRNLTAEQYIESIRPAYCIPKPFQNIEGVKKWIVIIILVCFLLFGLLGNLMSATIMFRRACRGFSSYFYLAVLAIVDIFVLYTGCLLFFLETAFDYQPQLKSQLFCRLSVYVQHLFTYISAWLIVAVTFERLIVVRYPLRSMKFSRINAAYFVTSLIFIVFSVYASHCFMTVDLVTVNIQSDQGYHPDRLLCDLSIHRHLFSYIDSFFYSILPSLLILIFNILIISTMFHAIRERKTYLQAQSYQLTDPTSQRNKAKTASTMRTRSGESFPVGRHSSLYGKRRLYQPSYLDQNNKENKKSRSLTDSTNPTSVRFTCLLLLISFIFVICTLPISIRLIIADYLPEEKSTTRWQLTQLCLTLLMFFNHAINVVLYCLTGRSFREESRKILGSLCILKNVQVSCVVCRSSKRNSTNRGQKKQIALMEINRPIYLPINQRFLSNERKQIEI